MRAAEQRQQAGKETGIKVCILPGYGKAKGTENFSKTMVSNQASGYKTKPSAD